MKPFFERLKNKLGINDDTETKFRLRVAADKETKQIVVDLGKAVSRFELSKGMALGFIAMLQKKVGELTESE